MATSYRIKVAWIRKPGYPVGQPAPGYLNCPCGAKPDAPDDPDFGFVECTCGRVYDSRGYIQRQESK